MTIASPGATLVVNLLREPAADADVQSSSCLYVDLRGTIEVLSSDTLFVIGQFDTAIFFLPDLASIADGLARLRQGAQSVEVLLLESPRLWFVRERRGSDLIQLRYMKHTTGAHSFRTVEDAFGAAVEDLLEWLMSMRPGRGIDAGSMEYLETIASVWPSVEKFVDPWRRHVERY